MGAMVTAYHDKRSLVVSGGQQDRRPIALEPLLSRRLVELARPYVKRSHEPVRAEDVPGEIQRAYHTAMQQPRGPVFVSIPMNDWEAEVEPPVVREVSYRTLPDPEELKGAAEILRGARSPTIVAGPGVARAYAFGEVLALAEKLRATVWQEAVSALAGFPQAHRSSGATSPSARSKPPNNSRGTTSCSSSGRRSLPTTPTSPARQ